MKRISVPLSSIAALALVMGLAVAAAGATQGTVVYRVQGSSLMSGPTSSSTSTPASGSYTVTETVSPGSNASIDTLLLAVAGGAGNFSYSRSINSSTLVQPFLPAIANQSFTYGANGTSVAATIARNGTVPLTFQGKSYSLASYAYSLELSFTMPSLGGLNITGLGPMSGLLQGQISSALPSSNQTTKLTGSILAFPSGLVYSVAGSVPGLASFSITLLSTTLPLNAGAASAATQVASIGIGAGAIVSALALGMGVRHRRQKQENVERRPDHWVD